MTLPRACWAVALALACGAAAAADKPCSKADEANAEKAIERVVNWSALQKAWQDYRHCDSGAVGDVYTDALLRLIVEWKNVDAFAAAVQKDAQFREFVHAHLRSPAAKDDHAAVYSRAKASCPKGMDAFCADLAETVKPAK
jgi:hypothetical protein